MGNGEYIDMIFKSALKPEPDLQSLRALEEAIALVAKTIENLELEDEQDLCK